MSIGSSRVLKNACLDALRFASPIARVQRAAREAVQRYLFEPVTDATLERIKTSTETMLREVCERAQHGYSVDLIECDPNDPTQLNVSITFRELEPLCYKGRATLL